MSDQPVNVSVPPDSGQNRLWGIPFFGMFVRAILVIPQAIILFFLGIGLWLMAFVSWIPILLNGRMAGWGYGLFRAYFNLTLRSALYILLIHGRYPPFDPMGEHPASVALDETEPQNRLWGIPILGIMVRLLLLIPHFLVLWVLGIVVGLGVLVTWIPVLVGGRQADAFVGLYGGYYRWLVRVAAYGTLVSGRYPPFRLSA